MLPAEPEAVRRRGLRPLPDAGQGLHRSGRAWASRRRRASASSSTRGSVTGTAWVTGADSDGNHVIGLVAGRDFTPDGSIDVANVEAGDPCPTCGSALETARGVEIGHIFQLGRRYAEALDLQVLNADGKEVTVTMGSYGIGVSRAVAAIAELTCDDLGLCWPREVAPADVHVVIAGKPGGEQWPVAERLATDLEAAGLARPARRPRLRLRRASSSRTPSCSASRPSSSSAAASPTASSRFATAGPATAATSRSPTRCPCSPPSTDPIRVFLATRVLPAGRVRRKHSDGRRRTFTRARRRDRQACEVPGGRSRTACQLRARHAAHRQRGQLAPEPGGELEGMGGAEGHDDLG